MQVLYAPNIHQGGGLTLLIPLLSSLAERNDVYYILDHRISSMIERLKLDASNIRWVKSTLLSRLASEVFIYLEFNRDAKFLCMASLPPLFSRNRQATVFIQNRYLIDYVSLSEFQLGTRIRLTMERIWLRLSLRQINSFVVQTETMRKKLLDVFNRGAEVKPYCNLQIDIQYDHKKNHLYDFIYVASGEEHKNHRRLLEAWVILAKKGRYPGLCLTLSKERFPELCECISEKAREHGLSIAIVGELPYSDVIKLYQDSAALIFPSKFESFGLPLLEAAVIGMPILASECDYVEDVVIPTSVFDPNSPESIADSVINMKKQPAKLAVELLDATGFAERYMPADSRK